MSELSQRLVSCLLFLERLLKQLDGVIQAEQPCPGHKRAIAGNFIMLNGLGRGDKSGVEGRRLLELLQNLLAFLKNAVDGRTGLALRALAENFEPCCSRSTWPSVSSRCFSNAAVNSCDSAPLAIFLRALKILRSA